MMRSVALVDHSTLGTLLPEDFRDQWVVFGATRLPVYQREFLRRYVAGGRIKST